MENTNSSLIPAVTNIKHSFLCFQLLQLFTLFIVKADPPVKYNQNHKVQEVTFFNRENAQVNFRLDPFFDRLN